MRKKCIGCGKNMRFPIKSAIGNAPIPTTYCGACGLYYWYERREGWKVSLSLLGRIKHGTDDMLLCPEGCLAVFQWERVHQPCVGCGGDIGAIWGYDRGCKSCGMCVYDMSEWTSRGPARVYTWPSTGRKEIVCPLGCLAVLQWEEA